MDFPSPIRRRILSYPSQTAIFPFLTFGHRLNLAKHSKAFRKVHSRAEKFHVTYIKTDIFYRYYSAFCGDVEVDTVRYSFQPIEGGRKIEIRCSLSPQHVIVSTKRTVARDYFQFFVQHSKPKVRQLELVRFKGLFSGAAHRRIVRAVSAKIVLNDSQPSSSIPERLQAERVEVHDEAKHSPMRVTFPKATHLVVNKMWQAPNEATLMASLNEMLSNTRSFQITCTLKDIELFMKACEVILEPRVHIGSFFTTYDTNRNQATRVAMLLAVKYGPNVHRTVRGRNAIILAWRPDSIVAVYHSFFGPPDQPKESFTVVKLHVSILYE